MFAKKNKSRQVEFQDFLCGSTSMDYILQENSYKEQIEKATDFINGANAILVGAGAGASAAAGLSYNGKRFTENFSEFIEKYGSLYMRDMYSAGFYPFPTEEAKWGYWSKHALLNRFEPPALPLYKELFDISRKKEYFVLTTNVDGQFQKAGFSAERIFATQGDYAKIQCQRACHKKTYYAENLFRKMDAARKNCIVPSELVPKCPVCGGRMAMNLRCDDFFVEDAEWHAQAERFAGFLEFCKSRKVVLFELGVGFNTPAIIRFPFEKLARENSLFTLLRLNKDEPFVPKSLGNRAVGIGGDMAQAVFDIKNRFEN